MAIRDSTLLPNYKNIFDPQQFEMEEHIAQLLRNNVSADIDIQRVLARAVVKTILGEFRPDMFEGYEASIEADLCPDCGGYGRDMSSETCLRCGGSGIKP